MTITHNSTSTRVSGALPPKVQRTVRHARKLRTVLAPLFPGYIFVILDLSKHRWRSVNGTIGVASLIMGAEQPLPVPPGVVEALIASSESSQIVRLDPGLEIGQRVRILSGPFAEALCELVHLDEKGRVRVLLEIMGGQVAVRPLAERRGFFSWGTAGSRPDEIRVLRLQQVAALPAPIKAARPFRHDAFEAKIARLGKHNRAADDRPRHHDRALRRGVTQLNLAVDAPAARSRSTSRHAALDFMPPLRTWPFVFDDSRGTQAPRSLTTS